LETGLLNRALKKERTRGEIIKSYLTHALL
jgi:hypothetical protein